MHLTLLLLVFKRQKCFSLGARHPWMDLDMFLWKASCVGSGGITDSCGMRKSLLSKHPTARCWAKLTQYCVEVLPDSTVTACLWGELQFSKILTAQFFCLFVCFFQHNVELWISSTVYEPFHSTQRSSQRGTLSHRSNCEQRTFCWTHKNTGPGTIISNTMYASNAHSPTPHCKISICIVICDWGWFKWC